MKVRVIIVTHNSQSYLHWQIKELQKSTYTLDIKIIDSGSTDTNYLREIDSKHKIEVKYEKNIGFVKSNNLILNEVWDGDFFLLLNPDCMIEGDKLDLFLKASLTLRDSSENIAIYSVPLVRYDIKEMKPLDTYDSLGIKCNYYGRWVDISQGKKVSSIKEKFSYPEAICGAFMLIDNLKIKAIRENHGTVGLNPRFKMYKEDIEICLRFKKFGYKSIVINSLNAYHCRGWNRKKSPDWARYLSAINDLRISFKYKYRAIPFALLKYLLVIIKIKERNIN